MADRRWEIRADDYLDDVGNFNEAGFRGDVREALAELEVIGERFGCGFVVAPIRREGDYMTVGWAFRTAVVPAARVRAQEPSQEPVEELPDPVEPEPSGDAENAAEEPAGAAAGAEDRE